MNKSITKLSSITFVGRLIGRGLSYGLTVLIARGLGAEALGEFAVAFVVLRMLGYLATLGLDVTAQRYIPTYRTGGELEKVAGIAVLSVLSPLVAGSILFGISYFGFQFFGYLSEFGDNSALMLILFGIPLYGVYYTVEAATRGYKETKYSVYIRDFARAGSALVLAAVSIYLFNSIEAVALSYVGSLLIAAVVGVVMLHRLGAFERVGDLEVDLSNIYLYSLPVAAAELSHLFLVWTDVLMLTFFVSSAEIGYYQAAYETSILITFALASVNSIFPSIASELYHSGEHETLDRLYTVITKWVTLLTLFAILFFVVFSDEILLLFGSNFTAARDALLLLAIGQAFINCVGPVGYLLVMSDYERLQMWNSIFVSLLNIVLNFVLIRQFGIVGAAFATAFSLGLVNVIRLVEVRLLLDIWPYSRSYFRAIIPLGLALVVMLFGNQVDAPAFVRLLATGVSAGVVFLLAAIYFTYTEEDRLLVTSI